MSQVLPSDFAMHPFLVDSGVDGAGKAVVSRFPSVRLVHAGAGVYWCSGMHLAWEMAAKYDFDFYMWLNVDTMLLPGSVKVLLGVAQEGDQQDSIVVGSCRDPKTMQHTYGGYRIPNMRRPLEKVPVIPGDTASPCETMNGNIVLVPRYCYQRVRNFDNKYIHSFGDIDYGMIASKLGCSILVAPGYQGEVPRNPLPQWADPEASSLQRLASLHSPKGLPPCEYVHFLRSHGVLLWPLHLLKLYMRVLFPAGCEWLRNAIGRGSHWPPERRSAAEKEKR